ncbi:hypothetical protein [Micromonospora echinofusca]|uniref:Uncharacterized protein n=1 Tax=Micromonospora echinofusca TaxID=47858 RepID=A0ABS3VNP3_MICEH|nr:hypothetical protein [Micromonospora echinofusca]MBO4206168.1 hypothetical protein [Micromonospora echinofusca]
MRLTRLATGRNVLLSALAFVGVFAVMTVAVTAFYDATGAGILNLNGARNAAAPRGGYTPDVAYTWLTAYGADGRINHLLILLLDVPLILSAVAFTALGLRYAAVRLGAPARLRAAFTVVAVAGGVLNAVEDAGVATLLLSYPRRLDGLASTVGTVGALKSGAYSLALLCTVVALSASAVWRRRQGTTAPTGDVEGRERVHAE